MDAHRRKKCHAIQALAFVFNVASVSNCRPNCPPRTTSPIPLGNTDQPNAFKLSDYAIRLREKQKLRHHYGVSEKQLRRYMVEAKRQKGNTGENLLRLLESRLDNVVFRMGFTRTIRAARQMVGHGHICINGSRVDIASYRCTPGERNFALATPVSTKLASRGSDRCWQVSPSVLS